MTKTATKLRNPDIEITDELSIRFGSFDRPMCPIMILVGPRNWHREPAPLNRTQIRKLRDALDKILKE